MQLDTGDCFILPSGLPFRSGSDPDLPAVPSAEVFARPRVGGIVVHNGGGGLYLAGSSSSGSNNSGGGDRPI